MIKYCSTSRTRFLRMRVFCFIADHFDNVSERIIGFLSTVNDLYNYMFLV